MASTHQAARGYRLRDLVIATVVVVIGATMVYTVLTKGAGKYNELAMYAFGVGGGLLLLALFGGAMIDRFTAKHPTLTKPHGSPLVFSILALAGSLGLIYAWMQFKDWFGTIDISQYLPW